MAPTPRFWEVFLDLFEFLPRQGPGNRACAERALRLCTELPPSPAILDLGCGVGGQTLHLAALTSGPITALDRSARCIERMREMVGRCGLLERIKPMVGDIAQPGLPPESFDLVWSEGALYNVGIEKALRVCRGSLRSGGYLAFTDAVWRKEDPPPEVKAGFDLDYPTMGWVADVLAIIDRCGFELIAHFTLPNEAWWDDFYTPLAARVKVLRKKYAGDEEAIGILDQLAREPELHRSNSHYYAYEFFVTRLGREL
ncbi:MAG: class I SAM-dependent methyltransferase, partial [Myxococcales bacterium]|nr:class I SAM-dependent methyltransferase [Myxococcales bacterium]MDD9964947.1 class I SAM-dependent methyltransferase [Myxococcales bacterium]